MTTERQVVMHPRTAAARRARLGSRGGFVRGQRADPADVARLIAEQRRAAMRTLAGLVAALVALPVVVSRVDWLSSTHVGRMPVMWIVLGPAVFPCLLLVARSHLRRADAIDRTWRDRQAPGR